MIETSAVIPASGLGKRLGKGQGKAFVSIAGRPLIAYTISAFQDCPAVDEIILVALADQIADLEALAKEYSFTKVTAVVPGGDVRQDSVLNGISAVSPTSAIIAVHDGARPFVTPAIIASSIDAARADGAAIVAVPVIDTIKTSLDGCTVDYTPEREKLYSVQTPQTFKRDIIECAYKRACVDGFVGTDDASLVERLGVPVRIVRGSYENIKVTTPIDIAIAEAIMSSRKTAELQSTPRVGHGYDIHRFALGRKLFLGGVEFPGEEGLLGHSDADVLLHAVADAILGAASAGDIGRHFPDTDPAYKDANSLMLLARAGEVVGELGWQVGNVDVTLIAERPKIAKHAPVMQENIGRALGIDPACVGVKATTAEGLGPIGEGLGIECHAVALLYPKA